MIFASLFSIIVGTMIIVQWNINIIGKKIPGLKDDPVSGRGLFDMIFHWIAEFGTALLLIVAGIGLMMEGAWGTTAYFVAMGMLIYTAVNSSGFFCPAAQVVCSRNVYNNIDTGNSQPDSCPVSFCKIRISGAKYSVFSA